jgi:hypothetical protein
MVLIAVVVDENTKNLTAVFYERYTIDIFRISETKIVDKLEFAKNCHNLNSIWAKNSGFRHEQSSYYFVERWAWMN